MALPRFGRRKVTKAALIIRKTGDGLSEALKFEPVALDHGDEVFVVLKGIVVDVQHPAEDRKQPGESDLRRVHVVDAIDVALITEGEAGPLLKGAADRLHEFRLQEALEEEREAGIARIGSTAPGEPGAVEEHEKAEKANRIKKAARDDEVKGSE